MAFLWGGGFGMSPSYSLFASRAAVGVPPSRQSIPLTLPPGDLLCGFEVMQPACI